MEGKKSGMFAGWGAGRVDGGAYPTGPTQESRLNTKGSGRH